MRFGDRSAQERDDLLQAVTRDSGRIFVAHERVPTSLHEEPSVLLDGQSLRVGQAETALVSVRHPHARRATLSRAQAVIGQRLRVGIGRGIVQHDEHALR